jgi:choice-of-anchor B domain-containing protein
MRFSTFVPALALGLSLVVPQAAAQPTPRSAPGSCTDGLVGAHSCSGVDLLAHLDLGTLQAGAGNSLWTWVDPETDHEWALMGLDNGIAFVDVTNPAAPVFVGKLPQHTTPSVWRDVRVYRDHAFVVSEAEGHGMQVFNLARLRDVSPASMPATFTADAHYDGTSNTHTMAITEESGLAVLVGSNTCNAGLHFVDIRDPMNPTFAGCFDEDGYTHETQCWIYDGPDRDHRGKEICLAFNEDTVTIVDATDRDDPVMLARGSYPTPAYTHQGWFTEDMRYILINDELDETQGLAPSARTIIMDLADLDAPEYVGAYFSPISSIDHNLYIRGDKAYLANYTAGLRILDLDGIAEGRLAEIAFFDTFPQNDATTFAGAWNVNPFLPSGTILISDINGGLFILREGTPTLFSLSQFVVEPGEGVATLTFTPAEATGGVITVERRFADRPFETVGTIAEGGPYTFRDEGLAPGAYTYRLRRAGASGRALTSSAVSVEVVGPPVFRVGAASENPFTGMTEMELSVIAEQPVRVALQDEDGNELRVLHNGRVSPDRPVAITIDGADLAPGVYMVQFAGDAFNTQRKLVRARG